MLIQRLNSLYLILSIAFFLCTLTQQARAVPDDRGAMGGMISFAGGGYIGTGADENGERLSSQIGSSFSLSFGEEVWSGLFLGLSTEGHMGQTQDQAYDAMFYAFGLESRFRLSPQQRGLILIGGLGIGGGGFTFKDGESKKNPGGSSGGSVWKVGLGYEIGLSDQPRGWTLIPRFLYQRLGPQMESEVSIDLVSINLELMWTSARSLSKQSETKTLSELSSTEKE